MRKTTLVCDRCNKPASMNRKNICVSAGDKSVTIQIAGGNLDALIVVRTQTYKEHSGEKYGNTDVVDLCAPCVLDLLREALADAEKEEHTP